MVNKEEYIAWRASVVHQELLNEIAASVSGAAAEILNRETVNTEKDQLLRGFIKGLSTIVDWQPEFFEDKVEVEEMSDEV